MNKNILARTMFVYATCIGLLGPLLLAPSVSKATSEEVSMPEKLLNNHACWQSYKRSSLSDYDGETLFKCAQAAFVEADKELNAVYREKLFSIDPQWPLAKDYEELLRDAQRQWIRLRDADCERISLVARGMANVRRIFCEEYHTRRRINELRAY